MHRVNQARARYNALVARWTKRMSNSYSLDVNYTFSRLEDNQFGESNTFRTGRATPSTTTTSTPSTACRCSTSRTG